MAEYSISELARMAGTTVRNVRAYQTRQLLPAPRRDGRANVYSDVHLARLRLIGRLLERGYSLANIAEMVEALERGDGVSDLLGLEEAITSPWSHELPTYLTLGDLVDMFGLQVGPATIARALELDLLRREGTRFVAPSPRLLRVGAELVEAGISLKVLLDQIAALRGDVERIADRFVRLVADEVFDRESGGELPPRSEHPRLAELVLRVRPMARTAVDVELARALEASIHAELGARLARMLDATGRRGPGRGGRRGGGEGA